MLLASLSETLGINSAILDLGVAGLALVVMFWLGRALYVLAVARSNDAKENDKENAQQIDLQKALVDLLGTSLTESRLTRQAFENNNLVLEKNTEALAKNAEAMRGIIDSIDNMFKSLQIHDQEVQSIKSNIDTKLDLILTTMDNKQPESFKIIIKDENGTIISELTATEEITETGTTLVVVLSDFFFESVSSGVILEDNLVDNAGSEG